MHNILLTLITIISGFYFINVASADTLQFSKTLALRSSGVEVTALQNLLKSYIDIYPEGLVTGYFGAFTEKAVKKFQSKYGMETVGIVGPKTRAKLNELIAAVKPAVVTQTPVAPIAPVVAPPPPATVTPTTPIVITPTLTIPPGFSLAWKYDVLQGLIQPPAIGNDGVIYYSAGPTLYAFTIGGTLKWRFEGKGILSAPLITNEQYTYVASTDGMLYSIKPDGTARWIWNAPNGTALISSPTIDADGNVYIGARDSKLYSISYEGGTRWTLTTGGSIESSPAIDLVAGQETIYFISLDKKLYATKNDGYLKWSTQLGDASYSAPAISSNGTIYFGADNGKLYAINSNGAIAWTFDAGAKIQSSPIIDNEGTIYVTANDGKLYAVGSNGVLRFKYALTTEPSMQTITPTMGNEGIIYAPTDNGMMHVINYDGTQKALFTLGASSKTAPALSTEGALYVGADTTIYAFTTSSNGLASSAWPKFKKNNRNAARAGLPSLRSSNEETATAQLASILEMLSSLLQQMR